MLFEKQAGGFGAVGKKVPDTFVLLGLGGMKVLGLTRARAEKDGCIYGTLARRGAMQGLTILGVP